MRNMKIFKIALILLALSVLPAYAGWVETTQEGVSYYGNGVLKQIPSAEAGGPESIMDFTKGTVSMVDHGSRTYTTFKFEEFCQFLLKMYEGLPPDMLASIKQENEAKLKGDVKVEKVGKGEAIAGYPTMKYMVTNDGQPERTVWLAEDAKVKKYISTYWDLAINGVRKMTRCDELGLNGEWVDDSPAYLDLVKGGWLMKEELVEEDSFGGEATPVEKLEEKDLPDSTFELPQGYKKVPLQQFIVSN